MTTMWMVQAATISLVAGLGLGYAIRFSLVARVQDRARRVAPKLGDVATAPVMETNLRRAPTA